MPFDSASTAPATAHRPRRPPTRRNTLDAMRPFLGRLNEGTVHRKAHAHRNTARGEPMSKTATAAGTHASAQPPQAIATSVADAVSRGTWAAQYTDAETLRTHTTSQSDEYTEFEARLVREVNSLRSSPGAYAEIVQREGSVGYPYVLGEDLWFANDADATHVGDKVDVPESVLAALHAEANAAINGGGARTGAGSPASASGGGGSGNQRRAQGTTIVVALAGLPAAAAMMSNAAAGSALHHAAGIFTPGAAGSGSAHPASVSGTAGSAKSKRAAATDATAAAVATGVAAAIEAAVGAATPERILQQRLAAQGLLTLDYAAVLNVGARGVPVAALCPSPLSAAAAASRGEDTIATLSANAPMNVCTVGGNAAELDLERLREQFTRYQRRRQALIKAAEEVRQRRDHALRALQDAWCTEGEKPPKRGGTASGGGGGGGASGRRSMAAQRRSDVATATPGLINEDVQARRSALMHEVDTFFTHQLDAVEAALADAHDITRRYMAGANIILDVVRALKDAAPARPLCASRGLCLAARETASTVLQYPEACAVLTALSRPATLAAGTLMTGMSIIAQQTAASTTTTVPTTPPPPPTAQPVESSTPAAPAAPDDGGVDTPQPESEGSDDGPLLAACATVTRALRQELANLADASHEACSLMGYFSGEVRGLQAYGGGTPRTVVLRLLLGLSCPHFTFRDGLAGTARDFLSAGAPEWRDATQCYEASLFHKLLLPAGTTDGAEGHSHAEPTAAPTDAVTPEPSLTSLMFGGTHHPTSLAAAAHAFSETATSATSAAKHQSAAAQRLAPLLWSEGRLIGCSWQRVYAKVPAPVYDDPTLQQPVRASAATPVSAAARYRDESSPAGPEEMDPAEPYTVAATLLVARSFEELDLIRQNAHLPLEEVRRLVLQDIAQSAARADRTDVMVRGDGELRNVASAADFTLPATSNQAAVVVNGHSASGVDDTCRSLPAISGDAPRQAVVELYSPSGASLLYPLSHPHIVPRWEPVRTLRRAGGLDAVDGTISASMTRADTLPEGSPAWGNHTTTCVAVRTGPPSQVRLVASLTDAQQVHLKSPVVDPRLVLVQRSEVDPWVVLVLVDLTMAEAILGGSVFLVHLFEASSPQASQPHSIPQANGTTTAAGGVPAVPDDARYLPADASASTTSVNPFVPIGVVRVVLSAPTCAASVPAVTVGGSAARTVSTLRAQSRQEPLRGNTTGRAAADEWMAVDATSTPDATSPWPVWLLRYLPQSSRLRCLPTSLDSTDVPPSPSQTAPLGCVPAAPATILVTDHHVEAHGWPITSLEFQERCGAVRAPLTATLSAAHREPVRFSVFLPADVEYKAPQTEALRGVLALIDAEDAREAALEAADAHAKACQEEAAAAVALVPTESIDSEKPIPNKKRGSVAAGGGARASLVGSFTHGSSTTSTVRSKAGSTAGRLRAPGAALSPASHTDRPSRRRSSAGLLAQTREEREEAVTALRNHSVTTLGFLGVDAAPTTVMDVPSSGTHTAPRPLTGNFDATNKAEAQGLGLCAWRHIAQQDTNAYAHVGLTKLRDIARHLSEEVRESTARYTSAKALLSQELAQVVESEIPKRKGKELQKAQADADALRGQLADLDDFMECLARVERGAKAAVVQRERDQLLRRDRRHHAEEELLALQTLSQSAAPTRLRDGATSALDVATPPRQLSEDGQSHSLDDLARRPPLARRASSASTLHRTDVRLWLVPAGQTTPARVTDASANVVPLRPSLVVARGAAGHDIVQVRDVNKDGSDVPCGSDRVTGVRFDADVQLPERFDGAAVLLIEGQEAVRWIIRA